MKLATLLAFLLFALPAQAQTASPYVQGGSVNAAPDTIGGNWTAKASYSFAFPKPLTAPCTVMVSVRGPEQSVSDSQGNSFTLATGNPGRSDRLFYSTTCASAADTVTVSCPSACWAQFTVSHYSGVWVPDQLSPEVLNVTGTDGYTAPVTPTQDGELIVVIGNNHTTNSPGITGANGFTVRANANQFIGDMLQAKAAPIYGEVTYATPVLWCQRTISYKPGGPPPPFVWPMPGFGTFTFPMYAPPDCAMTAGVCSIVACNTTKNICVTLLPGEQGSIVIAKPTSSVTVVQAGP